MEIWYIVAKYLCGIGFKMQGGLSEYKTDKFWLSIDMRFENSMDELRGI